MHAFSLRGWMTTEQWQGFLAAVTAAIDMDPVGKPAVWEYPLASGAGGTGATLVQPITESLLALDTWPAHDGAYLIICSCRQFRPDDIAYVFRTYGLSILGEADHQLGLT